VKANLIKISKNKLVYIDYTLHDSEGEHLNQDESELIYLHGGYGQVFVELENAVEGKMVDDTFKVTISPENAFGIYDENLVLKEQLGDLPEDVHVGMELDLDDESSEENIIYTVVDIQNDYATINGNHPLAGKTLTFEGVIKEIQELDEDAIENILEHEKHHHD
jgi:FKBP-type peptidyl-prolyl cis-trans isomerase SlyD